jgi:general secretion pathway protein A
MPWRICSMGSGVSGEGGAAFVLLCPGRTGEVGTGKTTISRCLLEQIPESCDVAYIFNPKLTVEELLSTICVEFGIACPSANTSIKVFIDCINAHLLDTHASGRHSVLIIDEAQNLSAEVLEQMRLLTNLETNERKLLQIILIGQPELATMLERPDLRQLAQRIVARYHLGKLSKAEVAAYVQHRLEVAGTQRQLFPPVLMGRLHRLSGGIPRVINVLCDRALLGTYAQGKERVDRATLEQAAREVFPQASSQRRGMRLLQAGLAVLVAGALVSLLIYWQQPEVTQATAQQPVTESVPPSLNTEAEEPAKEIDSEATLPEVLTWPADLPSERSKDMAYAALFSAWGADYQGMDPCLQAETLGLRCQAGRGGLDELRKSNRPAVLSMRDEQGREFFATLTALTSDSATFAIGANTTSVALSALASQWSGYYSLLWRMPPVTQRVIRPGDHGAEVEWLSKQLALVQGRIVATDSDWVFDDVLTAQVKQFQLSQGLTPDGNAGPQTLNRLVNLADQTAPRLLREQEES